MTGDEADSKDEQFASLLAAWDEALAGGKTPQELVAPGTPSDLQARLQRDLACVRLIRQVLCLDTSQPTGDETGPWPATNAPCNPMLAPAAETTRTEQRAHPMFGSVLTPSARLGPYEIVGPLGAGGMGEVYRARDTRLGREVAVKVLPQAFAKDPGRQVRFEREARAVAALSHPNILALYDYGMQGGVTYAVMELLEGETLRDRLKKGPLPWREAVEIGAAIADGLAAAHAKGIIHRDLKPENLFLTADSRAKILDFGLARMDAPLESQVETGPYVPAATSPGLVMGTAGYMSPEQVRGQPADARSDIFSFGCVLYEMVNGRRAFQRDTAAETMTAILHDEPPDPSGLGHPVPAELGRIIRYCLAKNPSQRLQSAHDLALGLRATASDPALQRLPVPRRFSWQRFAIIVAVLLIGVSGTWVYLLTRGNKGSEIGKPPEEPKTVEAIAVLPFQNVGGDPRTEYLSDGVADQIINSLSQVRRQDLKVRPFTSVARYKGKELHLASAGRELNVQMIVTGTLRQQGDELAIHVALVDVREEENNLWSDTYRGKLGEILDLQDKIARDVAANLRLRLTGEEERRLTKRYTEDPEAYLVYREAFYHFNKFTPEGFTTGIDYAERAIKKDPNYALAYVALARCHIVLGLLYRGPRETFPKARKHVIRALELDKSLPDAHSTLAQIYICHDWNWDEAERELKQAIELDQNVVRTHNLYGVWLAAHDRLPEALVRMRRAQELEPLVAGRRYEVAMCYNWMGRHDEAIAEAKEALKLDPNFPIAYAQIGIALVQMGKLEEAIAELQKALNPGPIHPWVRGMLGYADAAAGKKAEAEKELEELKALAQRQHGFAFAIARIYAALGEKDQAFAWLQKACDQRDVFVIWLKVDPTMGSLRSDPRFTRILETMRLPP